MKEDSGGDHHSCSKNKVQVAVHAYNSSAEKVEPGDLGLRLP